MNRVRLINNLVIEILDNQDRQTDLINELLQQVYEYGELKKMKGKK